MVDNKLRILARILATLQGERFAGAAIVRSEWSSGHEKTEKDALTVQKDCHNLLTVCCQTEAEQLLVTMLCGRKIFKMAADRHTEPESLDGMQFSAAAVQDFVQSVGDTNPIHQGICPIIPGLMLMEKLLAGLPAGTTELCLRFHHAAYAGSVAVDWSEGHVSQQGRLTAQFQWR